MADEAMVVDRHLTKFGSGAVASGQIEALKLTNLSPKICHIFYIYLFLLAICKIILEHFHLAHYMH